MKRDRIFRFCLCLTLCFALAFSAVPLFTHAAEETFVDEAANALREAMVQRLPEVTYTYESPDWIFSPDAIGEDGTLTLPQEEVGALLQRIYHRAIAHTGVPNQGDYLRWHIQECGENIEVYYNGEKYNYKVTFTISYYTTAQQEAQVTAEVQRVLSQLNLAGKTDYEKIKAIYDYICAHVVYDNAHLSDPNYNLQYTAYAALINGTSVCQGYSNLFYQMALKAGIDCRMIIGQSRGEYHAWNIVKLDGVYYNVDSTWDAVTGDYSFFLKTSAHMTDHAADAEHKQLPYPMATQDYVIPTEPQPTTQPQTQPTTVPATQPVVTMPVTQPAPTQATQPVTVPKTEPTTAPTIAAETEPTTAPATNSTDASTNAVTTGIQQPTQAPSDSAPQPEEKSADTWVLAVAGLALLAAAAGCAVLLTRKRK